MNTKPARLFSLDWKDVKKGIVTAVIVGALSVVAPAATAGTLFTIAVWKAAGMGAAAGLVGYLAKNFLTNSEDDFMTKEPKYSHTPPQ